MDVKASRGKTPADDWTPAERLDIARLIVNPASNGGIDGGVTAEQVAAGFPPDALAWGVWEGGRAVFVVGLWPFDGVRGCLHVAGDSSLTHTQHRALVQAFLSCVEWVEVFSVTANPVVARLARQVGLEITGELDGVYTLERRENPL